MADPVVATQDPPAPAAAVVAAAVPAVDPGAAPAAAVPTAPEAEPTAEEKKRSNSQKRIDALTREKWEEIRARSAAERRAQELEEQLNTLRSGQQPATPAAPAQVAAAAAAAPVAPVNLDALVNERARTLQQQQAFNARCNEVYSKGKQDIPDFDAALQNFSIFGGLGAHQTLVQASTTLPDGHKVLHFLGTNLDDAGRILQLPPIEQAIELSNIANRLRAGPIVSSAPAPITPLAGGGGQPEVRPDDNGDFKTQEDFRAWKAKQFKKR